MLPDPTGTADEFVEAPPAVEVREGFKCPRLDDTMPPSDPRYLPLVDPYRSR
jgi:hypothetical protein